MVKLDTLKLQDIMPQNLLRDPVVADLAEILSAELQNVSIFRYKLNYTSNVHALPEDVIDHLLWEYHMSDPVEGVLLADTVEKKANLLEVAIELHRKKGTPYAIERVLQAVNLNGEVVEWFEDNSAPYHFVVELQPTNDITRIEDVRKMVLHYKNKRSWFDGFVVLLNNENVIIFDDSYSYPVYYKTTGEFSGEKEFDQSEVGTISILDDSYDYEVEYPVSEQPLSQIELQPILVEDDSYNYEQRYPVTGELETFSKGFSQGDGRALVNLSVYDYKAGYPVCGEFYAEGEDRT